MDLGQIIYIIAIVAYFIYNASKKKKSAEPMDSDENQPEAPPKGLTFEELLKEIRNAQNPPAPEAPPAPKPQPVFTAPAPTTFQEPKTQPKRRFEPVEEVDDEAKFYEGAFESSVKKNPYQALANKTFVEPEFKRFKSQEIAAPKVNKYAELLKNPKTVKEAIIVSEILRPKHF
ncbi:MAG: hypothetical protein KGZ90_07275 [Algoriphagus sp.]|nr:hypothetical protein [Algoriphagus sp.]